MAPHHGRPKNQLAAVARPAGVACKRRLSPLHRSKILAVVGALGLEVLTVVVQYSAHSSMAQTANLGVLMTSIHLVGPCSWVDLVHRPGPWTMMLLHSQQENKVFFFFLDQQENKVGMDEGKEVVKEEERQKEKGKDSSTLKNPNDEE